MMDPRHQRPVATGMRQWGVGLLAAALATAGSWGSRGALCAADLSPDQQIESLYGADLKKIKTTPATTDDLVLAKKLIEDGLAATQNRPFQAALLRKAFPIALEDPTAEAAQVAEKAILGLVAGETVSASAGWHELTDKTSHLLRRRNLGKKDPLFDYYLKWLRLEAEAALAQGDQQAAERTLNTLVREAQYAQYKYDADEAQMLLARARFEAPFRAAVKRDWTKWQEKPEDAELKQKAGEAALTQMGDWAAAEATLGALPDSEWPKIFRWRKARLLAPAPKPKEGEEKPAVNGAPAAPDPDAQELLSAADLLTQLAAPAKSSVVGRAELLGEAARLVAAASRADQTDLTTQQKLQLTATITQAAGAAQKAQDEAEAAFARTARVAWIPLLSANRAADWTDVGEGTAWRVMENNVLEGKGNWDTVARSVKAPKLGDFVLEGEFARKSEDAHPFFLLREHSWAPCYEWEVSGGRTTFYFVKGGENGERGIEKLERETPQDRWIKFRVVFDGSRYRFWLDEVLIFSGSDEGELSAGGLCIGAANGTVWYRNLRVRELP